jgi:hypothetical protein
MSDYNPIHAIQDAEDAITLDILKEVLKEVFAYDPFEKYGPEEGEVPKEPADPAAKDALEAKVEALEEGLRSLASYVGAGGYNADEVDPKAFVDKVRWGIDNLTGVNHVGKLEAKIRDLEMRLLASRSARKSAERRLAWFQGHSKNDLARSLASIQEKVHEMSVDCQESAEHLEKEVAAGQLYGDFKHPKAERADVLRGCANRLARILTPTTE